jgi:hypothetical protein
MPYDKFEKDVAKLFNTTPEAVRCMIAFVDYEQDKFDMVYSPEETEQMKADNEISEDTIVMLDADTDYKKVEYYIKHQGVLRFSDKK